MNISEYLSKVKKFRKSGMLGKEICKKIHKFLPVFIIKNKNIRFENEICKVYEKYKIKYNKIIKNDNFVDVNVGEKNKKIWICWFQGEENAPDLVKACISSVKKNMIGYEVIIITDKNIDKYTNFPDYILKKRKQGKISAAHFSDLLRTELLCSHGGIWIDATVLCTCNEIPKYIEQPFFVYKQMDLIGLDSTPIVCSSWIISSRSNNPVLLKTRELLWYYWKYNNKLDNYFLFHIFLTLSTEKFKKLWNEVPFWNNHNPHLLQKELLNEYSETRWIEITSMSEFHKLNHHIDFSNCNDTMYNHIIKQYLNN